MKIKRVKIHNWRSIKDLDIEFQDLMVFIGQNNHGKSNVLSSLLFFFGVINCQDLDFNKGTENLYIEVTFSDLDEFDKKQFSKYLTASFEITVRKQVNKGGSFEYHGYCQIPREDYLKEEKISEYLNRDAINATPLRDSVPTTGRITKDIVKKAQQTYMESHREEIEFSYDLEETNFLGLKTVAQGIFGDIFFVPAVKNASEEFNSKGKSIFNQLLTNVINDMSSNNADYIEIKNKIKDLTQTLNKRIEDGSLNGNRPKQIAQLESLLEAELNNWQTTIDIEITPPDVDEAMRLGTSVWVDDGVPTDVNRKGHGLQRSLIFALVKAWAKISQDKQTLAPSDTESEIQRRASKSTYFIFEEPELYLHPQAQRELYASLKKLSEINNQVLISTHASSFIDLSMYKSICIIYKNNIEEGSQRLQCSDDLYEPEDEKKKFNMTYWINPDRGELFFAKKVILLEGPTDKTVIPFLAKKLGIFRHDYTLIDCGGKTTMPIYMHLLNKFHLPYVVVYDKDYQSYKNSDAKVLADNASDLIQRVIDSSLGSSVIFVNDIEEEINITNANDKNKPYYALEKISDEAFVLNKEFEDKIRQIFA